MEIIRRYEGDGDERIEFYTLTITGESGMSQTGLALLAGVSRQAIIDLETTLVSRAPSETLKPFVGQRLTLVSSSDDPRIDGKPVGNLKVYRSVYCAAVIKHYAAQQNDTAIYSLLRFAEIGINTWIQGITGWVPPTQSYLPHTTVYIERLQNMRDHEIADDKWMIFREAADLLLLIEREWRVPINDYDILDGSIGRRWSDYRKTQEWAGDVGQYIHNYRDRRGPRECNAYDNSELKYFRAWLRETYRAEYLPKYLVDKYGKRAVRQIYTENGLLTNEILELTEESRSTEKQEKLYRDFLEGRQKLLGGS